MSSAAARPLKSLPIRWYLLLLVGLIFVPALGGASYHLYAEYEQETEAAADQARTVAQLSADQMERRVIEAGRVLSRVASLPGIQALDPAQCSAALAEAMALLPRYTNLITVNREGDIICSAIPMPRRNMRIDRSRFLDRLLADPRLIVGHPNPAALISGQRAITVSYPIWSPADAVLGAVSVGIHPLSLAPDLPDIVGARAYLIAANRTFGFSSHGHEKLFGQPAPDLPLFRQAVQEAELLNDAMDEAGVNLIAAKVRVPIAGWTLVVALPKDAALAQVKSHIVMQGALYLGIILLGAVLAVLLARRIERPLLDLTRVAMRARAGDLTAQAAQSPVLEISAIEQQINRMLGAISARESELKITKERLRHAVENSADAVWDWDLKNNSVVYHGDGLALLGYRPGEILPSPELLLERLHPDDREIYQRTIRSHLDGSTERYECEFRVRTKSGAYKWVLSRGAVVQRDAEGRALRAVGTHTDIDRRKTSEEHLRRAAAIFEKSPQAIVMTDAEQRIVLVNPAFEQITGYLAGEVIGQKPSILSSGRQDAAFYETMHRSLREHGEWHGEIWNKRKDGALCCEWLSITQMQKDGEVTGYIGMFIDITQRKEAEAQIEWQAYFDPLTGLPNRRMIMDRMERAAKQAQRDGRLGAVLLLDLDRFKEVNDTLGHPAGDELLVTVARRLSETVRESDTVGRLGGDEFVILLGDVEPNGARAVASKILAKLGEPVMIAGHEITPSGSVGIAVFPDDASAPSDLLRMADTAMYAAKAAQRGSWRFFTRAMQQEAEQRMALTRDLRAAIAAGALDLHFQPIHDIASGRIAKAEGLVRWNHPTLGFVSPAVFIPLAEETGLIHDLGSWVLRQGLAARCALLARGLDVEIAVNLSARQFQAPHFVAETARLIAAEGAARAPITLEITESLLLSGAEQGVESLRELRKAGALIALDDFGTGYSSLSYLARLPADLLKIDRSFITGIDEDYELMRLVRAIIDLGHDLGMRIVAEGVETANQYELLADMGCNMIQGYFVARPMPLAELAALCESRMTPDIPVDAAA